MVAPGTACSKRCASTRWRNSASPARRTPCGRAIVTTTHRLRPCLTRRPAADYEQRLEQAEIEMDNLRNALGWNLENRDTEQALKLASSLQPVWLTRGRILEGLAWFHVIPAEDNDAAVAPAVRARALADEAVLNLSWRRRAFGARTTRAGDRPRTQMTRRCSPERSPHAVSSPVPTTTPRQPLPITLEAIELARALDDQWRLSQILAWQANTGLTHGDPMAAGRGGEEGRDIADAIGDRANSRQCQLGIGWALLVQGKLAAAIAQFRTLTAEWPRRPTTTCSKRAALMGLGHGACVSR